MDIVPRKCCTKCGIEYPATTEYFYDHMSGKYGLSPRCKKCLREEGIKYHRANGYNPQVYGLVVGDKRQCTKCEEWFLNTHEFFYRNSSQKSNGLRTDCKNCSKSLESVRRKTPERKSRATVYNQRPEVKERQRKWQLDPANKWKLRLRDHRREARKHNLPDTLTAKEWDRCLEYFNHTCAVCGRPQGFWHTIAMDHWIPICSLDCTGTVVENVVPLCHGKNGCNNSKHNTDAAEWLIWKFGKRKAKAILKRIQDYFDSLLTPPPSS